MGRGSSKVSTGGNTTPTGRLQTTSSYDQEVESLARGMLSPANEAEGVYPMSNSDLEAAVEAYAMTHPEVDEDVMLNAVRDRVDELSGNNSILSSSQMPSRPNVTARSVDTMSRSSLVSTAQDLFIRKQMRGGLSYDESLRRFNLLVGANTDAQLKRQIKRWLREDK